MRAMPLWDDYRKLTDRELRVFVLERSNEPAVNDKAVSRVVLITGCSTGIGHATARRLALRGWTVYASARRPDTIADLAEYGRRPLALDVTDEASMVDALAELVAATRSKAVALS